MANGPPVLPARDAFCRNRSNIIPGRGQKLARLPAAPHVLTTQAAGRTRAITATADRGPATGGWAGNRAPPLLGPRPRRCAVNMSNRELSFHEIIFAEIGAQFFACARVAGFLPKLVRGFTSTGARQIREDASSWDTALSAPLK